jgi:hypothetical protein
MLLNMKVVRERGEWFRCGPQEVQSAILAVREGKLKAENRNANFKLRPEQEEAIDRTKGYFESYRDDFAGGVPKFLWNAKMRFGKTFASYKLAQEMGWTRLLVLTFKPAVQSAWQEDLETHVDFEGWQFVANGAMAPQEVDKTKPIVCFGSFQDFLGKNSVGGIKSKNEWVHALNWDCVIFDEYHFGAWRENAKDLFESESAQEREYADSSMMELLKDADIPITTNHYLYLSGTPFRAIATGEFIEEQIYNWTYSDEQRAKQNWEGDDNPYASLPRMVLMTYKLPENMRRVALQGEFDEFDLNIFFEAEGEGENAKFKYENEVQKWLDMIRGALKESTTDELKQGMQKPAWPFSHTPLLANLTHTLWFLPKVNACHAMASLLKQKQNRFYHDYNVVVAAGPSAGVGVKALEPVLKAMGDNPLESKTITLSCGKLTTGVTVRPWTGIFMLRNTSSPETYFQAAFRVQSPWTLRNPDGMSPNQELVLKEECYVFDFAPNRALRQIVEYSSRLDINESNPEVKVREFIKFLPILAYDGSSMTQIDAEGVMDMALSGTTATLLAKKWESVLLVNVDNNTLRKVLANPAAMEALMKIEGFRALGKDTLETIINKSDAVKKAKKEANEKEPSKKEIKEISEEEKEYKKLRKQVQEKLIKFSARIPVFMYMTDYREYSLEDVILKLEPALFEKVTGITKEDFGLLVTLGVFNSDIMNSAVYQFKRYEDASLEYTGLNRHEGERVGGYDSTASREEFLRITKNP